MLSKKQEQFLKEDLKRINLLYGSVRSGKTWISLLKWAIWVGQQPNTDEFLMVGKTLTTLKRNCLGLLEQLIGNNISCSISQKKALIFGRTVWLEGANDGRSESKIRGMTLKGAYVDELTQIPKDFYLMLLSRLSVKGASLIATTNPDHPNHYVKVDIIDNTELNKKTVKFLLDDNIFLDEKYKENLKKEYTGVYYQRFINGEFVRAEGLVFPKFADDAARFEISIDEIAPKDKDGRRHLQGYKWLGFGFDIGGNGSAYSMTCSAVMRDGSLINLLNERKEANEVDMGDIDKFVFDFIERAEKMYGIRLDDCNCDHIDAIINTLNAKRYIFGKTYKPPLEDRVIVISKLMNLDKFKLVKGMCEPLKDTLCNLIFDESTERAIPLDDGSYQCDDWDSMIYSVSSNWHYLTD